MKELRKNLRYTTLAKIKIKEYGEEEFVLKDLSVTGCRMECSAEIEILPQRRFKLEIMPESEAKVNSFFLDVESKWIHLKGDSCEAGFSICESPKGKQFQRYVDYLSWRYSHGDSMTHDSEIPSMA